MSGSGFSGNDLYQYCKNKKKEFHKTATKRRGKSEKGCSKTAFISNKLVTEDRKPAVCGNEKFKNLRKF